VDTQLKKGVLELCVLALLSKRECYGYEIVNMVSLSMSEGTVYPLLRRLKKDGLLTTYIKESKEGPARKYYRITAKGLEECKILKNEWRVFSKKVNRFLK